MATLQEDQGPIDLEIAEAIVESVPAAWRSAVLVAERTAEAGGAEGHRITIRNPDGRADVVVPTAEVMLAVRKLALVFARHGHPWSKATYALSQSDDGDWDFVARFEYA